jgi:hypothetical protein
MLIFLFNDELGKILFSFRPQSPPPASERLFGGEKTGFVFSYWSLVFGKMVIPVAIIKPKTKV